MRYLSSRKQGAEDAHEAEDPANGTLVCYPCFCVSSPLITTMLFFLQEWEAGEVEVEEKAQLIATGEVSGCDWNYEEDEEDAGTSREISEKEVR